MGAMKVVGICIILALFSAISLLPIATFLILFTTLGEAFLRWQRKRPARKYFRFGLRSLLFGMTVLSVVIVIFNALVPEPDFWRLWHMWIMLSIPLSGTLLLIRFCVDAYEERDFQKQRLAARQAEREQVTFNATTDPESLPTGEERSTPG